MFFWLGIIFGVLCAGLAIKIGFYDTLVHFINTLISIYLALFLTPLLLKVIPGAGDIPYGTTVTTAVVGIASFLILYGISYMLLIGQFKVAFAKAFDTIASGLVGFLMGFMVLSFVAILAWTTSLSQVTHFLENNTIQSNMAYVCWWCDHIHGWVGSVENIEQPSRLAIYRLKEMALEKHQKMAALNSIKDVNEPASPNDLSPSVQEK